MVSLPERRREVTYLKNTYELSERRACGVVSIHRSSYRHDGKRVAVDATHAEVVRLSDRYPYWGYRKVYDLMDRDTYPVGRERVRLIRRREGLQVIGKPRKRRVLGRSTQWLHRSGPQILNNVVRCSRLAIGGNRHGETEAVFP